MIQALMYYALGLLSAGLVVLLVTPLIWRRAMRLVRARVESSVPMTLSEIQAEKDHLRAEFAVSARRLELQAEKLRTLNAEQAVEIGRHREAVARLTNEEAGRTDVLKAAETRAAELTERLSATEEKLARAVSEAAERREAFTTGEAALIEVRSLAAGLQQLSDEQKLELAARSTELANLADRLSSAEAVISGLTAERDALGAALAEERTKLAAEGVRAENLSMAESRLADMLAVREAEFERQLEELGDKPMGEAERQALEATVAQITQERDAKASELARQAAALAELEQMIDRDHASHGDLQARLTEAGQQIAALEAKVATGVDGDNMRKAIAATEAENEALLARLAAIEAEHARLLSENQSLQKLAVGNLDQIETENAALRDKLAGVAAEVVRLSDNLFGAPSIQRSPDQSREPRIPAPPRSMPMPPPSEPVVAAVAEPARPADNKTLAERLRALQHSSARR